jgi:hypothetical protein
MPASYQNLQKSPNSGRFCNSPPGDIYHRPRIFTALGYNDRAFDASKRATSLRSRSDPQRSHLGGIRSPPRLPSFKALRKKVGLPE